MHQTPQLDNGMLGGSLRCTRLDSALSLNTQPADAKSWHESRHACSSLLIASDADYALQYAKQVTLA